MKRQFIVERQGKSFALYAGLLDEAHSQGLKAIRTALLQAPSDANGNVAICQATVETERGTFGGIADASPANAARAMLPSLIRLAETRAKARALRDAVNVGVLALEETDTCDDEASPAGDTADVEHCRRAWLATEAMIDQLNNRFGADTVDRRAFADWFTRTYGTPYSDQAPVAHQEAARAELQRRLKAKEVEQKKREQAAAGSQKG